MFYRLGKNSGKPQNNAPSYVRGLKVTKKLTDANKVPTVILLYRIKDAAALRLSLTLLYCERQCGRMKEKHVLARESELGTRKTLW